MHPVDLSALLLQGDQCSRGGGSRPEIMSHGNGTSKGGVCNGAPRWSVFGARCSKKRRSGRAPNTGHQASSRNHSPPPRDQFPVTVELLTIRQAIEGDEAALRALWTRHAPHIDLVVRRLVGHDQD